MAGILRLAALAVSILVLLGFALFALERTGESSRAQVEKIDGRATPDPTPRGERRREREHGTVREAIDDANDVLLSPFTGVADSRDAWVQRIVPGALALFVFSFGLALLANFLPRPGPRA